MSDQKVKLSAFLIQLLASLSISVSVSTTLIGISVAWPSSTIEIFTSNSTVLWSPMTTIEISLLGSLVNLGALFATPLCGYSLRKFGRKYTSILYATPFVIAWTIISFTSYVSLVLIAATIAGLGSAGLSTSSIFISELSQNSIRGVFVSFDVIFYLTGVQLSYIFGAYMTYNHIVYTYLSLSIINVILLATLKDSPVFLMQNGLEEEAAKSIAFYRCIDVKSAEVDAEVNRIKLQLSLNAEFTLQDYNDTTEELLSNHPKEVILKKQPEWKFLLKSESSKRALVTCLVIMIASLMLGITVQVYAEPLFKEIIPSMDSKQCAIYLGFDFIIGTIAGAVTIDKFGRKIILTASCAATGICTLLLGTQLMLHWAPHWFTAFLIYTYTFVYSVGAGDVPFVLPSEVFLPEVRGLCISITIGSMWLTSFVSLFIFNPLVEVVGHGVVFCIFSVISFLLAIYTYIYLPETKGLSADAIQVLFMKKKSNRT